MAVFLLLPVARLSAVFLVTEGAARGWLCRTSQSAKPLLTEFRGMAGAIAGGWMGDRFGLPKVVVGFFAAAAVSIALIGLNPAAGLLFLLVFVAGATSIGTQILLYARVAQLYNLSVRSTGLGWASGVGRIGAIVGPTLGGVLLARELPLEQNFLIFAIPAAVSTLAMLVFALNNAKTHNMAKLAAT